jgi:hypothetical protein
LALRWAFAAHFLASNGAVDDLLALAIVHCGQLISFCLSSVRQGIKIGRASVYRVLVCRADCKLSS